MAVIPEDLELIEGDYLASDEPEPIPAYEKLRQWETMDNVATELDQEALNNLAKRVCDDYSADKTSRAEWEKVMEVAMKVAKQVVEQKTFPWPNAANVKYPLLAVAAMQFAARSMAEIIPPTGNIVGGKVIGSDPDNAKQMRSDRVSRFMNIQLNEEIDGWVDDTDTMLHVLPIMGLCWRKSYWDGYGRKPASEFYSAEQVVVNYHARRGQMPRRITHLITDWTRNDVLQRQRAGLWLDIEIGQPDSDKYEPEDSAATFDFLECYCWYDLDGDGYAEPWIVTVHERTRQVVRVVARYDFESILINGDNEIVRIDAVDYWTKYGFIPPPDGSFYDIGFGWLLNPLNHTVNSLVNRLLDAGTMQVTGGGFLARGANMPGGSLSFRPGEWKPVQVSGPDLKLSIVPLPVPEPSPVLFKLLEFLLSAAQQLTSVSDQTTGQPASPNEPATTTMARLEQGMKVFSSIHSRLFRALSAEFRILFRLNGQYLSEADYREALDDPGATLADFDPRGLDVRPTADPNIASDMQRVNRATAILQTVGGAGGNVPEASRDVLKAMHVSPADIERYIPAGPDPQTAQQLQQMQQMVQALDQTIQKMSVELESKDRDFAIRQYEAETKRLQALKPDGQSNTQAPEIDAAKVGLEADRLNLERENAVFERDFRMMEMAHKMDESDREHERREGGE